MQTEFTFSTQLWLTSHENPWVFLTVPTAISDQILDALDTLELQPRGFGSVKVNARIGDTKWSTSLFPDKGAAAYVMPVKKAVRLAEQVDDGDTVQVALAMVL